MTRFDAAGSTDPGQVRAQNQDTFYVSEALVLIADGMGGYAGGEVAAAIAAEVMEADFATDATAQGLEGAVLDANRRIYERGVEPGLEGMGTTLVAVAVVEGQSGPRVLLANVGDSRAYLARGGVLRQLTQDHSVAAELVRLGRIDEREGAEHPGRHVLTRALGVDVHVEPDLIELDAGPGDRVLLCSDGLSNELADDDILRLLQVGTPVDAARALVAAANAHGGLDNITAVVADVIDDAVTDAAVSDDHATSAVAAAPLAPAPPDADAATGPDPARAAAPLALRPVLSRRERRRRRREDRRERRAWNKWVSFRGVVFLLAFAAVLVGGFVVLRWYATSNYVVAVRNERVVVIQGRLGGFLWWKPKIVFAEKYGPGRLSLYDVALLGPGISEPTLADAKTYISNHHQLWLRTHHGATSTTTTTLATTGGT